MARSTESRKGLDRAGAIVNAALRHGRARRPAARALGHRRHRWRRHWCRHRRRCGEPRLRRPAPGAARLRERDVEPEHQTRARRCALSRTGQHRAGDGGAQGTRASSTERPAPGQQSCLRRAQLRLVGSAVLRPRPQDLQRARRQVRVRLVRDPHARRDAGATAHDQDRGSSRRRRVLRRPVRRHATADQSRRRPRPTRARR